jgi:hypothetical protein
LRASSAIGLRWGALLAVIAVVGVLFAARPAAAAEPGPSDADVSARLAYVERALGREERWARVWSYGWLIGFSGLVVGQSVVAITATDDSVRAAAVSGAIKSALGAGVRLFLPFTPASAAATLRRAPAATPAERRAKLRLAESLLRQSAAEERFNRSWFPLTAGAAVNLAGAYVLWAGYHRYGSGWFGLGAGVAVSQLQYWTQPTGLMGAWGAYLRAFPSSPALPASTPLPALQKPGMSWSLAPSAGGAGVQLSF